MDSKDIYDIIPLDKANSDLVQNIINAEDDKKVKDLINLFNLNQVKKNTIRVVKLNSLLDKISDQMLDRFTNNPHEFTNNDLLQYMTTVQTSIDRANKYLNLVNDIPLVQVNEVNLNVGSSEQLSRESRLKITEAINQILKRSNELNILNNEEIIIEEGEKNEKQTGDTGDDNGNSSDSN